MSYDIDPDMVYINLSAAAGTSTVTMSSTPIQDAPWQAPAASYDVQRYEPIVSDLSKYQLAVIKCSLNGCRNLPVFVPSMITATQTAYAVNATLKYYTAPTTQTFPTGGPSFVLFVQTYQNGTILTPWTAKTCTLATATNPGWASTIASALTTGGDAVLTTATVTGAVGVAGLSFACTVGSFDICVGINRTPAQTLADANAFGFPSLPLNTPASSYVIQMGGSSSLDTPNFPFFVLPTLTNTFSNTQYLQWKSQTGVPLPSSLDTTAYNASSAYWCLDYEWFCDIFNSAIQLACKTIATTATNTLNATTLFVLPKLVHDSSSRLFSLYVDSLVVPPINGTVVQQYAVLELTLNPMLSDLMQFPAQYNLNGTAMLNTNALKASTDPLYPLKWESSFVPTATLWSPIDSLVFMTSNIPVRFEITTAPVPLGSNTAGTASTTSYSSASIITDVTPSQADATDWRGTNTLFQPTYPRWADLPAGTMSLKTLNFSLGWRNGQNGSISPILLNPNANFTVKFLFKKRGVPYY